MATLEIRDLSVRFATNDGTVSAVNGVNLTLDRGETLGIVGESGSGKSQLAFSIMGLLAKNGRATGSVRFEGQEILNASRKVINPIRANKIAMVFQDPMTSLGALISEGARTIYYGTIWQLGFPLFFFVITLFAFFFVGDGLRDAFDPKDR